jgi:hypothetical protein
LAQTVVKLLDAAIGGEPGVTEDSIDQRIAYAKKNNPLQASVRQHEYGYTALVTDANTGKPSWFGGAVWQTPELAMGHAKAFVKGFPYLEQRFAQRFIDKNRDGIAEPDMTEGIMSKIANKVMGAAPEQPKYKVGQRVKYETSPHQPDWADGGSGVGVITDYKNGHYMINSKPVNHFEIKGVVEQGVAEGAPIVVAQAPIDVRNPKKAPQPYRNQGDIVPDTKPPSTEKRGVKGRPGQRPMPQHNENNDYLDE